MQIILNDEEAQAYQDQKIREAILAETSKFPASMRLPDGYKIRPTPLSDESKAEILKLHASGMGRTEIARELHLPGRQVSGVVQGYIQNVARKPRVEPKIEGLQPMKPLVMPVIENPPIEPACSSCGRRLGHNKVAIGGKFYCDQICAPEKVPVMATKKLKPPKSNSEIDGLIVDMASKPPIEIADEINRAHGGAWMPNDVTKRLAELRSRE